MKQTLKLFIHRSTLTESLSVFSVDVSETSDYLVCIGEKEIEFEVPEDDIRLALAENLERQIVKIRAESEAKVTSLKTRIQELTAIGSEVCE